MLESLLADEFWLQVLRFLCGSTVLLGAVWLLESTGWVKHLRLRAYLWKLALLGSLLLLVPLINPIATAYNFQLVNSEQNTPITTVPDSRSESTTPAREAAIQHTPAISAQPIATPPSQTGTVDTNPGKNLTVTHSTPKNLFGRMDLSNWLLFAWLVCSSLALLRLFISYRRGIRSLGERREILAPNPLLPTLHALCDEAQLRHKPKLTVSPNTATPVTLLADEICLPEWADTSLPADELKGLLAHELAHIRHRDLYLLLALQVLACVFFFQPLFLLARNRLMDIAEFLADQWAATQCRNASQVASALLTCADQMQQQRSIQWGFAMVGNRSRLRQRVDTLLRAGKRSMAGLGIATRVAATSGILAIVILAPSFQYGYAAENTADRAPQQAADSPDIPDLPDLPDLPELPEMPEIPVEATQSIMSQFDKLAQLFSNMDIQNGDSITIQGRNNISTYRWANNGVAEEIRWRGEPEINEAENDITGLSDNGFFEYRNSGMSPQRQLRISERDGKLVREYQVDGQESTFESADREWFNEVLVRFLRRTGINAEQRVARLLKQGGVEAVIQELTHLSSDRVTRVYVTTLVESTSLSADQFQQVMEIANSISSDSEMRRLLLAITEKDLLDGEKWTAVLSAARTISSDSEMRRLLSEIATRAELQANQWEFFLEAAGTISSDSEMRRLLAEVVESTDVISAHGATLLDVAQSISSDSEMRRLLGNATLLTKLGNEHWPAFFTTAAGISSDSEMRRLVIDVVETSTLNENAWRLAIETIDRHISSSSEKSRALRAVAEGLPDVESLQEDYNRAVLNVSSRSERERLTRL